MKKLETINNDIKEEYDFAGQKGVRGKYHKAYREGHQVVINNSDGTSTTHFFKPEDGSVIIDPDIRKFFSTAESVNKALRMLISVIPAKSNKLNAAAH